MTIVQEDLERILSAPLPWEDFSGATILVTGAAGFIPAYMVETLLHLNKTLKNPCRVIALVRDYQKAAKRFAAGPNLDILVGDVCDIQHMRVNYILHAASPASPKHYLADPIGTLAPNTKGTMKLLEMSRQAGFRGFLFLSSGDAALPLDPLDPRSCYGESKRMGETMCMAWHREYGVPVRIARISHTYGPGMRLEDGRVFADFTRDILDGGPIVLNSDGRARRCFCYLSDAATALFTLLLKGTEDAYNVANPYADVNIGELADRLAKVFRLTVERAVSHIPQALQGDAPNIDKLKALGWTPEIGVEEGFQRTVESYRGTTAKEREAIQKASDEFWNDIQQECIAMETEQ